MPVIDWRCVEQLGAARRAFHLVGWGQWTRSLHCVRRSWLGLQTMTAQRNEYPLHRSESPHSPCILTTHPQPHRQVRFVWNDSRGSMLTRAVAVLCRAVAVPCRAVPCLVMLCRAPSLLPLLQDPWRAEVCAVQVPAGKAAAGWHHCWQGLCGLPHKPVLRPHRHSHQQAQPVSSRQRLSEPQLSLYVVCVLVTTS